MRIPPRRFVVTFLFAWGVLLVRLGADESTRIAAEAVNALGLDLLRQSANKNGNFLLSPYSIQTALAMTYAGADGATRTEMARVLHYPSDEAAVHASFAALQSTLAATSAQTQATAAAVRAKVESTPGVQSRALGTEIPGSREPFILEVANRLYGQTGFDFRASYLTFLGDTYGAALEQMDFKPDPGASMLKINSWIGGQTHDRISNLLTASDVEDAALLLVNAVYLKAPWEEPFSPIATKPLPSGSETDRPWTSPP